MLTVRTMADRSCNLRVLIDILMIVAVGVPLLLFKLLGVPYRRGFFCDDESIRFPYKDSTITAVTLYFVGFLTPIIVMGVVEAFDYRKGRMPPSNSLTFLGSRIHPLLHIYYCRLFMFGFGCCVSQFATDIGKFSVGRLRPHFLSICQPNWDTIDCGTQELPKYVQQYLCSGDPDMVQEARLSFPSGHASFSAFTMVFLALYIQAKVDCNKSSLVRPVLQFVALMSAIYTALSRISDHKHHWSDVLSGSILGTAVAFIIVFLVCDNFKPRRNSEGCSTILPLHSEPLRQEHE